MAGDSVCPRNEKISVKHKNDPFKGPVFELGDFDYTDITPSENDKCSCRHSDLQSSEMLSTADLISAVGYAWNRAKKPLSVLLPKTNSNRETKVIPEGGVLHYSTDEGTFPASDLAYDRPCPVYLNSKANSGKVQENVENLKANWKTSWPQPCYENFPFQRTVLTKSTTTGWSSIENCLWSTGIPPNFRSVYGWMSDFALAKQKNQVLAVCLLIQQRTVGMACMSITIRGWHLSKQTLLKLKLACQERKNLYIHLQKQEHAVAGAMAGIFVSLCLHPMDTVKTVIQSCRADQKPLHSIGKSIIAERGMSGLYRGISSNILSSAPISAVYTFTYESVKKSLTPLLPREYHSLAHCTAGGCASIATSFIFTPSERIKQQMQVGSHYRNCWNALIQVVQKGGFPSLYAGWGAVLCRNVPHSVIKFYTYESLKPIMSSSIQSNAQANTSVTLVCGGLAGSMASLFTTPFDVVKTRLQTQIPGSTTTYNGVFNTLKEIGKHEGLKGLYRGLTPRLVMYMVQGALFFASYESFKRLFSLDVPRLST
ncbi:UNVERIFIED_CONTAM: Mitoferrin [Sesamum angustifolium]|uniref:Mitoferrin n=1 Tax=Sesamum angustifolium TaxID=2727405 RepID=A0AAW2MK93_9LAMI